MYYLLLQDVAQVMIFLGTCLLGFSISIHTITNAVLTIQESKSSRNQSDQDTIVVSEEIDGFGTTAVSLFWSVFGLIDIPVST